MSCFKMRCYSQVNKHDKNDTYFSSYGYSPCICKHCICDFRCGRSKILNSGFLTTWGLPQTPVRKEVKRYGTAQA